MWKAHAAQVIPQQPNVCDDDWETDPDFVNDVTEEEQRWGSKTIEGSGKLVGAIDINKLREQVKQDDANIKRQLLESGPKASYGYGGKFGVQEDRMDKTALGHDYIEKVEKHTSQKDYSAGFGGKFGVQKDRQDNSAVGFDYKGKVEKHDSQKDYTTGFGGKFGVQKDRIDKSAVGWDYHQKLEQHESQKDYSVGFGGKFGIQSDRQDASAAGWDEVPQLKHHSKQVDMKKEFVGKLKIEKFQGKSAVFSEEDNKPKSSNENVKPEIVEETELPTDGVDCEPTGVTAIAMYDYQAAADDEISFDPDEIITNIEMIDEGWWRGECRGKMGLFPANYVQLQE